MATQICVGYMTVAGRKYTTKIPPLVAASTNVDNETSEWAQRVKESDGLIKKVKS
jgi:hypothetical protein